MLCTTPERIRHVTCPKKTSDYLLCSQANKPADEQDDMILNKPLTELKWCGGTSNMHRMMLFFLQQRLQSLTDGQHTEASDLVPGRPFFPYQYAGAYQYAEAFCCKIHSSRC